ncbi:hypothetical protein [Brevibacillus sp. SIMBA_040]|uniref:hypothetical protein n=1 Tax=unclassified Brevibacillus TaxID=2684853 RepID=UPI00397CA7A0
MVEALGVKLFHRLSKGVKLTTEGEALYHYIQQSFSLLHAGKKTPESKISDGGRAADQCKRLIDQKLAAPLP